MGLKMKSRTPTCDAKAVYLLVDARLARWLRSRGRLEQEHRGRYDREFRPDSTDRYRHLP